MGIKKGVFRKAEAGGKFKRDGCIEQNVSNWNCDDGDGNGYNVSQAGRAVDRYPIADAEGSAAE